MSRKGSEIALSAILNGIPVKLKSYPYPLIYLKVTDGREGLWWSGFKDHETCEDVLVPASDVSLEAFVKNADKLSEDEKALLSSTITLHKMKKVKAN